MEIAEPTSRAARETEGIGAPDAGASARPAARAETSLRDVFRPSRERGFFERVFDYLVRLNGSPEEIAWGLALGLFVAMTPTVGLQTLIAIPLAGLLRVNKASAALGVWLTNPLTIPFFYGLTYFVGARLLGHSREHSFDAGLSLTGLLDAGPHVILSLLAGGAILGAAIGLGSYLPVLYMVRGARATARAAARRRRERRERRARERAAGASEPGSAEGRR